MHLVFQNVNDAFKGICSGFKDGAFALNNPVEERRVYEWVPEMSRSPSRYGEVIVITEPVTISYEQPLQRVLFNPYRDANPFFHLIEAMWTLAYREDIAPLKHYNSKVTEFSDDGETWRGAYGARWWYETFTKEVKETQVTQAINILKKDRTCRRVVLTQYTPKDLAIQLSNPNIKDIPCNTEVMFLPRKVRREVTDRSPHEPLQYVENEYLDMTVINRSNDMLWGSLGSNYVVFSFLLEYVALAAGYEPGRYHQISNNLHVYTNKIPDDYVHKPGDPLPHLWSGKWYPELLVTNNVDEYPLPNPPLFFGGERDAFDTDLRQFFDRELWHREINWQPQSKFFKNTVWPLSRAWNRHKARDYTSALEWAAVILQRDWSEACTQWLQRRKVKYERKQTSGLQQTHSVESQKNA